MGDLGAFWSAGSMHVRIMSRFLVAQAVGTALDDADGLEVVDWVSL